MKTEEMYLVERKQKRYRRKPRKIQHEWWPNDIERLIQLVENQTFLWDSKHCHYKDKALREQSFENIAEELQRSVSDCKQKWENLRVQFRSYYAKQLKGRETVGESYKVKWQYYEAMTFLIAVFETNTDNVSDDNSNSQSSISDFPTSAKKRKPNHADQVEFSEANDDYIANTLSVRSSKADQVEFSEANDKYIANALSVYDKHLTYDKRSDSAQIFGDYVADRLRRIKEGPAELLKEKITLLILQTLKAERNSDLRRE